MRKYINAIETPWMSTNQFAQLMGMQPRTVRNWASKGWFDQDEKIEVRRFGRLWKLRINRNKKIKTDS